MKQIASIFFGIIWLTSSAHAQNNVLPQANLDLFPDVVKVGEYLNFDASASRDSQGQARNLEYRFQVSKSAPWTEFRANAKGRVKVQTEGQDLIRVEIRDRITGYRQRTFRTYQVRPEREAIPPRIKLISTPPFAAGQEVGFEVVILTEPSVNINDIMVAWDFNSDGKADTPWQKDKRGYNVYQGGNLTSPTVAVKYPNGRILKVRGIRSVDRPARGEFDYARDVEKLTINPTRIQSPIVNVSPGFKAPNVGTTFTFDASRTQLSSNSYLEYYFDGVKRYTDKVVVKHRFQTPGEHTVRVRHCINRTNPECRSTEVNITVDQDGTDFWADFNANEKIPGVSRFRINDNVYQTVVSSEVRFTGQVHYTANGQRPKFEYRWDFDGDGKWDTPYSSQISAEHTYDRKGTFRPQVEIRDDEGTVNTATKSIIVLQNRPPIGRIRTTNWPNYAGQDIQFQIEAADSESNLSQLEMRFDLDGDGIWDTDFRTAQSQRWRYDSPGNYKVVVQIRDPQKELTTVTRTIPILATPKPELKVEVSHRTQVVGQPIVLNAANTSGQGLTYEWKILDDPYAPVAQGVRTSLRFNTPGERTICLRVIDQEGQVKEINFPIEIVVAPPKEVTQKTTPPQGGGTAANAPKPTIADAVSDFETEKSDFIWSDGDLFTQPAESLGTRPGF